MQLAARQGRLEHVARVDRAFGLAGTDHRMQFVDEHDRLTLVGGNILEHGLQALLEFAAIFSACEQQRHVQRQHAFALERLGDFAVDDALRKPFDDCSLADARLTDQHRVVLGSPLQDLNRATNFVVAPDHGIELAVPRALGEIDSVFFERFALTFRLLRIHASAATHGVDRGVQRLLGEALLLEQPSRIALVVGERLQE